MSGPRACLSCGQNSAFVRRVRCGRCGDQVHPSCRDLTSVCYQCRYRQAREGGITGDMLRPSQAGESPFERNQPATVAAGQPVPKVASLEERYGKSANEVRVLTAAVWAGWHIEKREEYSGVVTVRKHGRGYLRLYFSVDGRIVNASTQRRNLPLQTPKIIEYLEK
ncbi:hypothetical protein FNV58_00975 (plasmid) [Streptomyces sp. RLB1-9]|uniref:hypothetical protein n=1 Tax=Streptomyces sp. RLB1-9 TaxID=2594454 RepID=UPI001163678C|nr:hypothetical protein [Streptomyces sp. RLB1-9]QDN94933.1 hypothetical protein FNV58_00975 [Streptomyces sp. RLB1-9]